MEGSRYALIPIYQQLLVNFKGESFDFLAFSEEPAMVYNHKYKKKVVHLRQNWHFLPPGCEKDNQDKPVNRNSLKLP